MGLLQSKLLWLALIPLGIHAAKFLGNQKNRDASIILILGIGLFVGNIMVLKSQPTQEQWSDLQEIVNLTGEDYISNDWYYGHWLNYLGARAMENNMFPKPNYTVNPNAAWALTNETLNHSLVKDYGWVKLYSLK